jgi:hypothetical protein
MNHTRIDQHQACEDFVGVQMRLEEGRNTGKQRAAQHAEQHHQRQDQRRLPLIEHDGQDRPGDRPHDELAFGADIPVVRAIADR